MADLLKSPQYETELSRLTTFANWPETAKPSALTLSHLGFFYSGLDNSVICWRCGYGIGNYDDGDNIRFRHKQVSPRCPTVTTSSSDDVFFKLSELNVSTRGVTQTDGCNPQSDHKQNIQQILNTVHSRAKKRGVFDGQVLRVCLNSPDFDLMRRELVRLKTYLNWPCDGAEALAAAGFFYTGTAKRVQCAFCRNVCDWEPLYVPFETHKDLFPDCAFVRRLDQVCANVPKENDILIERVEFMETNQLQPDSVQICDGGRELGLGLITEKPKHPDMKSESLRRETFSRPEAVTPKGQNAAGLARAGFYYVGPLDYCRCFFCGGGLKNWQEDDVPWEEHARWYPCCTYVKLNQPQEFILLSQNKKISHLQQIQPRISGTMSLSSSGSLGSPSPQSSNLSSTSSNSLSKDQPQQMASGTAAPANRSQQRAGLLHSVNQTPTSVRSKSRNKKKKKRNKKVSQGRSGISTEKDGMMCSQKTPVLKPEGEDEEAEGEQEEEEEELVEENEGNATELQSAEEIELKNLVEENQQLKETCTCKVCSEKEVSVVFLPCGHLVCCQDCAPELRTCAICRALIRGTVKTFFA